MPARARSAVTLSIGLLAYVFLVAAHAADGERVNEANDHRGADRGADDQLEKYRWGLGLGLATMKSPYLGKKNVTSAIPIVSYENDYLRVFGNTVDAKLPSLGPLDFSLRARLAIGEGYEGSDSLALAGMATRRGSVYLGGAATWRSEIGRVSLDYGVDASGHSKGSQLRLGFEHAFRFAGRFELVPHVAVTRVDSKYVDYFYGVKANEATAARGFYQGKSTVNTEFGLRMGYAIDRHQRLLLDVVDERYGSAIRNSPIVGRSSAAGLRAGYVYGF